MLKLTTIAVAILVSSPALACYDEVSRPVARYSYGYTAPMSYARYAYAGDDDYYDGYYGGYYGYGGLGLAVGAGVARRAYWRNRVDHRANWRGGRGFVGARSVGIGRAGGIGRVGGGGRIGRR
jgi:hypothetical protein